MNNIRGMVFLAGIAAMAALLPVMMAARVDGQDNEKPVLLGVNVTATTVDGLKGVGVDEVKGIAKGLGVKPGSFIYRIKVTYKMGGKNKVDNRRTLTVNDIKQALKHDDLVSVSVVWRKNQQWYRNQYEFKDGDYVDPKKIAKEDIDK
jgi:hypothetical protein